MKESILSVSGKIGWIPMLCGMEMYCRFALQMKNEDMNITTYN